jgi:hypothetical protein
LRTSGGLLLFFFTIEGIIFFLPFVDDISLVSVRNRPSLQRSLSVVFDRAREESDDGGGGGGGV